MKTLSLGTIATNLSTPQQVFTVCLALLSDLNDTLAARHRSKAICQIVQSGADLSLLQRYQLSRANSALLTDLNRFAPPLTKLGWHRSELCHLGVWIDLEALHAAERDGSLTQVSGGKWPSGRSYYVLDMGSGSLTLYRRRDKREIWQAT